MTTLLRYRDAPQQRWRNGRGSTRELHSGDGWRLSVATLTQPAEFSRFDGLDRTFVMAAGEVELSIGSTVTHLARGAITRFPGETPVTGTPLVGRADAVNVMTRRGRNVAVVSVQVLDGPGPAADALVLLDGGVCVGGQTLEVFDAVLPGSSGVSGSSELSGSGVVQCRGALVVVIRIENGREDSA